MLDPSKRRCFIFAAGTSPLLLFKINMSYLKYSQSPLISFASQRIPPLSSIKPSILLPYFALIPFTYVIQGLWGIFAHWIPVTLYFTRLIASNNFDNKNSQLPKRRLPGVSPAARLLLCRLAMQPLHPGKPAGNHRPEPWWSTLTWKLSDGTETSCLFLFFKKQWMLHDVAPFLDPPMPLKCVEMRGNTIDAMNLVCGSSSLPSDSAQQTHMAHTWPPQHIGIHHSQHQWAEFQHAMKDLREQSPVQWLV